MGRLSNLSLVGLVNLLVLMHIVLYSRLLPVAYANFNVVFAIYTIYETEKAIQNAGIHLKLTNNV